MYYKLQFYGVHEPFLSRVGQSSVKFTLHPTYLSGFSLLIEFTMVISAAIYGLNGVRMALSDRNI